MYKWDGYGAGYVWRHLWGGSFFDHGRAPVLTLLAALGFLLSLFRGESRFFAVNFLFWGGLLCGRPTWGGAIDLLPAGRDLHLHRVIGAFQFHGVFLAGIFLGTLSEGVVEWVSRSRVGRRPGWSIGWALIPLLFLLPLLPLGRERFRFYAENERWGAWNDRCVRNEVADLEALFRWLREHPWGRIYPGLAARWGGSFKVGYLPLYAFLGVEGFDAVAFLYHAMSLNSDLMVHFDEWNPAHYNLMNVRYVVSEGGRPFPPFVREVTSFGRFHLYRANVSSGYFDVVRVGMTFRCDKRGLYDLAYPWMESGHLARRNFPLVLLEGTDAAKHTPAVAPVLEPGDPLPPVPAASPAGRVIWERAGPPLWEAEVEMAEDAYILFKMTDHPKWRLEIDGTRVAAVMLGPSFVGVPAPAGRHRVTARYSGRPERWLWLGLGILLWLWADRRERRGRSRTRLTPSPGDAAGARGA
ncbi:MAG: hypothetical protein D6812_12945 [Deltaproteobacteria bacterium]|nr:MAG: hypothetical protein D6812_12945 [Deltaproteobacteria bacterium]